MNSNESTKAILQLCKLHLENYRTRLTNDGYNELEDDELKLLESIPEEFLVELIDDFEDKSEHLPLGEPVVYSLNNIEAVEVCINFLGEYLSESYI